MKYVAFVLTAWFATTTVLAQQSVVLKAGAATSNITPPLGEEIVGGWKPIPARHIHDELFARCLILDDGNCRLGIVICDNVGIPREVFDAAKAQIEKAGGPPASHLLMASTHTHSATTARSPNKVIPQDQLTNYQSFLASRIADGMQRAINNLEPAKVGFGSAIEPSEVFNRRWHVTDPALRTNPFGGTDQVRMNPPAGNKNLVRPAGPVDPEISFVSVQATNGRPISLLANYSLHYVGGVRSGDVSADYFGYFANDIRTKLGAVDQAVPFVGMLSNGTSGDINNIDFENRRPRSEPYERMQIVAKKVAGKVYDAHQQLSFQDTAALKATLTELSLSVRQPTKQMQDYLAAISKQPADEKRRHNRELIYHDRIQSLSDAPKMIDVPIQAFAIGNIGIVAIPFETFAEIGLEIKERSPFKHTFVIELANGSFGYLPTPEQHKLGGYETWLGTNYVEVEASRKITETALTLLNGLQTSDNDR